MEYKTGASTCIYIYNHIYVNQVLYAVHQEYIMLNCDYLRPTHVPTYFYY